MELERELQTYLKSLPSLVTYLKALPILVRNPDNVGKFVLIHGGDVIGVHITYDEALKAGYDAFGLDPFMVSQIQLPPVIVNRGSPVENHSITVPYVSSRYSVEALYDRTVEKHRISVELASDERRLVSVERKIAEHPAVCICTVQTEELGGSVFSASSVTLSFQRAQPFKHVVLMDGPTVLDVVDVIEEPWERSRP